MEYIAENQICQNCKQDFTIQPDDFAFYGKMGVPAPSWCPHCRFVRRTLFINERSLYKRSCGHCNKSIVTMYHPDIPMPVWCVSCHLSDAWDAGGYGRDYDFSIPFFKQFKELKYSTPHRALDQNEKNDEGCEYSNYCYTSKNVYLSFVSPTCENIKYSKPFFKHNKNCLDSLIIKDNDRGYELIKSNQNYNSSFLVESDQCIDSQFLYDCSNCVSCFMSSNIRNKSYFFRNVQLTKEEYHQALSALKLGTYSGQSSAKEEFKILAQNAIHKHAYIKNSVNAKGDYIENSKNVSYSYGLVDAENVKHAFFAVNTTKDSQDLFFTGKVEECYEFTLGGRGGSRLMFSFSCGGGSSNLLYCDNCKGCADCFGCAGLNKKQYCILNKQYTKEKYFEMIDKIKLQMDAMPYLDSLGREYKFGEFFPIDISPFAYNETITFEEIPLSKDEALANGHRWRDMETKAYNFTVRAEDLPDSILDVPDSICDEIIACPNKGEVETQCVSAYKILPDELQFYRQMNLPLPRYCPNCRYHQRLVWKNPFFFYTRSCMCEQGSHGHKGKCEEEFETMYSPEKLAKIYCKSCYQKEVY